MKMARIRKIMLDLVSKAGFPALLLILSACQSSIPVATDIPTPSPTPEDLYIKSLKAIGLDEYIGIRSTSHEQVGQSRWVSYSYAKSDCQCISGDEYRILVRPGSQADKTVFWMEGGGACWPGVDKCAQGVSLQENFLTLVLPVSHHETRRPPGRHRPDRW